MKRRLEPETLVIEENKIEIKENILQRLRYFRSQGIKSPFPNEDEKINQLTNDELSALCLQIEELDAKISLNYLDKFLEQKEAFKEFKNKLMVQGPELKQITDHCYSIKAEYFEHSKNKLERQEEQQEDREEESDNNMNEDEVMYGTKSHLRYHKLREYLTRLVHSNEKKFTDLARLNKEQEKELKSTLGYCLRIEDELAAAKLEIERLNNEKRIV
jgi:hypothetical protein